MAASTSHQNPSESLPQNSILNFATQGVNIYLNSQKSLFSIENPNLMFSNSGYILIQKPKFHRIEKHCVSLIDSMLNEYFAPYACMEPKEKVLSGGKRILTQKLESEI